MPRTGNNKVEINKTAVEDERMGEITLKSKKSDILEALNAALLREKQLKENRYNPAEEEEKSKNAKTVEETLLNVKSNIFSEDLNLKFRKLEEAIRIEEAKLSELYGIEGEMNNLAIVMMAKEDALAKAETENTLRMRELEVRITQLEEEYAEKARNLELERSREVEEYEYQKKRVRKQDDDQWNAYKAEREKKMSEQEARTLALLAEAEEKAEYLSELEKQVAEIPTLLENEYSRGQADAIKEVERENKFEVELMKKDFQGKIDRQTDVIDSLKAELARITTEKDTALSKLDQAYLEIRELATKTVEATGGIKILGGEKEG